MLELNFNSPAYGSYIQHFVERCYYIQQAEFATKKYVQMLNFRNYCADSQKSSYENQADKSDFFFWVRDF